ncbi:MAG: iron-containing alcohol dehydrogenase [Clostridia bacterium]|nr:iron-containing alcohol dehydrogenase [Clostridia bacterium]
MRYAEFSNGTKILDGENGIADLHILFGGLGASRIMIIGDRRLMSEGYLDKVKERVLEGGEVAVGAVYLGEDTQDSESALKDLYFVYMSNGCDGIVVCGSGKLVDYAKLLRLAVSTQVKDIKKFFNNSSIGRKVVDVPLITIPRKLGVGSECNALAVYYDSKKKISRNIFNQLLSPDYCIIDGKIISSTSKSSMAYGVLSTLGKAIDGFIAVQYARVGIAIKRVEEHAVGRIFSKVALTNLKAKALEMLASDDEEKIVGFALDGAYLSKGLDSNGMGMIYSLALAISDVKGVSYSQCLPLAIKASLNYNLRVCQEKYSKALWSFVGWREYSKYPQEQEERAKGFVHCVEEFVDEVIDKYIKDYQPIILTDDDRQDIAVSLSYNPHILNNPRHFDPIAIKAVLR